MISWCLYINKVLCFQHSWSIAMSFLISWGTGLFLDTSICSHDALMDLLQIEAAPGFIADDVSTDIQPAHWKLLVSWMYETCSHLKANPSVFPMAVLLLSKRLDLAYVDKESYQKQAATAIFIASKVHDYHHVRAQHITRCCGSYFSSQELLNEELNFLHMLNYRLLIPSPCEFLGCFLSVLLPTIQNCWQNLVEDFTHIIARVFSQRLFLRRRPSLISAAALLVALKNIHTSPTDLEFIENKLSALIRVSVLDLIKETQTITYLPPLEKIDG